MSSQQLIQIDRRHVWHPYTPADNDLPLYPVASAKGCTLTLTDGRDLLDGMSSWWSTIHGYNHPALNAALQTQLGHMAHVMFGGLTHEPAVLLAQKLVAITPKPLQRVFFSDSGSVAVEVAMKMALQYWQALGETTRTRFLTPYGGYYGDTFAAMSVCDPINGMHHIFSSVLAKQIFAPRPTRRFHETCTEADIADFKQLLQQQAHEIAAVILEPIVQGAGGMWFYSPEYLRHIRQLCDAHNVLLIADEIATGFGRTGKLFACEHADIAPDILCLGKALTGGYMTLAATLCTDKIATTISSGEAGVFMHGPTFMGNPLACSVANASIDLLLSQNWQANIHRLETQLSRGLLAMRDMQGVTDVRVLGAIGVIELQKPVDMRRLQPMFVERGIWLRPFGRLVYMMPPYIMNDAQLQTLTTVTRDVLEQYLHN